MLDNDYLIKGEMYQYNLGWLIKELMSFKQDLATAIDLKTIKYADPIQWDITTQYPANTVVVDPKSGTAYMSKVPVPAGVELTNTNYWVVVFNYQDIYNKIMDGVAFNDRDQDYATKDLLVNDLVWYAGDLYRVTRAILTGSKYIPGANLIKTSIESLLARYYGRDRTAQVSNDTVNVSGDYTLVAGDIAETSTNRTIKTTKDREVDVDGSDSVHVDGASTLNVGGLRTEAYAGNKTEKITGNYTGDYGSASLNIKSPHYPIIFPDKTVDLHSIEFYEPSDPTDIGAELNSKLINKNILLAPGEYTTKTQIFIPLGRTLYGYNSTVIFAGSDDYAVKIGADISTDAYIQVITALCNIIIDCNHLCNGVLINAQRANLLNIKIRNPKTSGIDIYPPTYAENHSADTLVQNADIVADVGVIYDYGIRINGSDCTFENVRTLFSKVGFYISERGSGSHFTSCHPLAFDSEISGWEDSAAWEDHGGNTFLTDCYADNFKVGYLQTKDILELYAAGFFTYWWEYKNTSPRYVFMLYGGCTVNAIGVHSPNFAQVIKIGWKNYYYPVSEKVNISFSSPNEPNAFRFDDYGNYSLFRYYNRYEREFNSDTGVWRLIGVIKPISDEPLSSTISIMSENFAITGLSITPSGRVLNYGIGTNTDLTIQIRKDSNNVIYVYGKLDNALMTNCICEVHNYFLMLPRLWNPSNEPTTIIDTHSYKVV